MKDQVKNSRQNDLRTNLLENDSESKVIESEKKVQEGDSEKPVVRSKPPLWGYPLLILCGASGAMDGPFSQLVTTDNAFLRMSWKFQGVFVLFLLYKIISLTWSKKSIREEITIFRTIERRYLRDLVFVAIGLIGMQSFLSWGAAYTIMSHANLFSSLVAVIIVTYRLLTLQKVTKVEILGSLVAVSGCVMTSFDGDAEKVSKEDNNILLGNILSFCSSLFATIYITQGQIVSRKVQTLQYFIYLTFFVTLIFFTIFPLGYRNDFTYSFDEQTGLFGWLTETNFLYCLIVLSLVNGCGTLGLQYLVFKNFSPIIAGTMMLQEPFFSQLYGVALGLDKVPGLLTDLGGLVIVLGLFILVYFSTPEQEVAPAQPSTPKSFQNTEFSKELMPNQINEHK